MSSLSEYLLLQGRALLNAIGNLELRDAYAQAIRSFGYELEAVIEQVEASPSKSGHPFVQVNLPHCYFAGFCWPQIDM